MPENLKSPNAALYEVLAAAGQLERTAADRAMFDGLERHL